MSVVLLDTNFLIRIFQSGSQSEAAFGNWLAQSVRFEVSMMAWAEFLCGPVTKAEVALWEKAISAWHPTSKPQAVLAAELFNQTKRRTRSLPDCLIAARAIEAGLPLATENTKDFLPFVSLGLQLAKL